jgi:hypothetical protein
MTMMSCIYYIPCANQCAKLTFVQSDEGNDDNGIDGYQTGDCRDVDMIRFEALAHMCVITRWPGVGLIDSIGLIVISGSSAKPSIAVLNTY